jgi:hypothetical protein
MSQKFNEILFPAILLAGLQAAPAALAEPASPGFAVGAQYDTSHVYVAPADVDRFAASFLATFGGHSTKQVVATVTPTQSSTTSQSPYSALKRRSRTRSARSERDIWSPTWTRR